MADPGPDPRPDERLVAAVLDGDDGAFAVLAARHKRQVLRIAARFSRTPEELEELGQEIFLSAYEDLGQYRGEAPFSHWLSRIAVRRCYDLLRKRSREIGTVPLDEEILCQAGPSATGREDAAAARAVLDRALMRLRPAERLVITLLELEDRTVREVAVLTGWSEVNVKVRAFRARRALRRILEEADGGKQG
jgi:RNA polymerase sigma-70 factor (ECF subfamily)